MLRRSVIACLAVVIGLGFITVAGGACSGPYSGKAERVKRPKEKKRPESEQTAESLAVDDQCRSNFFAPPTTRRNARLGRSLSKQAETTLYAAEAKEGRERILTVQEAMGKLTNALEADPYGPAPTYKLAVAYALVGKKGCALALLDRLQMLTRMPEVESEANRVINQALRDQAFDPYRKEADAAMGR
ncbi:hypothetical protein [Haliangium sp.]|uniref:hypothetical protein n=1 Tax=Haliangium sp. TaxID=2663208 RepID=UPI003D13DCD6